jgi:hypothetical protein
VTVFRAPARTRLIDGALWAGAGAALAGTLVLSLGPAPPEVAGVRFSDKLLHGGAYAVMTVLWLLAAVWRPGRGAGRFPRAPIVLVIGFGVLGVVIELLQLPLDRTADPMDALADVVGVALGYLAWRLLSESPAADGRSR